MKMLMIMYRNPYPLASGEKIRMFQNLMMLSDKFTIDLAFINEDKFIEYEEIQKFTNKIISFKESKLSKVAFLIWTMINRKPLQVNYYRNRKMKKWIKENINNYDVLFANHLRTAQFIMHSNKLKIIDHVDSISLNMYNAMKQAKLIKKVAYYFEYLFVKKYERNIYNKFDINLIISDHDSDFMKTIGIQKQPIVIPNYARDLGYYNVEKEDIDFNTITFIGKLSTEPNITAIEFFINSILPELPQNVLFSIIGKNGDFLQKKYKNNLRVEFLGFLDNPVHKLIKSNIIIAPMISGSGIQNKIIETMLLGKTVVTTNIGATGLNDLTGKELIVCDSATDMINKCLNLLGENNYYMIKEIGLNARKYILNHFGYKCIKNKFISEINKGVK